MEIGYPGSLQVRGDQVSEPPKGIHRDRSEEVDSGRCESEGTRSSPRTPSVGPKEGQYIYIYIVYLNLQDWNITTDVFYFTELTNLT